MQHGNDQKANPLGTRPIGGLLLKYATPSVISMLVMSIYNIADQVFIGRSPAGFLGNGATTVAFPLVTILNAMAQMVGNGSAAYISLEMGKGNTHTAKRITSNAVTLLLLLGVGMTAVVLLFLEPILRGLGATDLVLPYAVEYTSVLALGAPFIMIGAGVSNIIRADGSPRYSMVATLSGALLNIVLDPIFIFDWGLGLGVRGAAIATVLSQLVCFGFTMVYVLFRAKHARLERRYMRPVFSLVRRMCTYGSSNFMTQMAITIMNVVMNNTLVFYGAMSVYGSEIPLSSMGIVMKINAILISAILGVVIGAQPILGFNYGAKNYRRVMRTYKLEVTVTFLVAAVVCLLFHLTPETFIRIFGDQNQSFNDFAAKCLRIFMGCVFCAGVQIPSANFFQAIGKPIKAMTLSMTRQLILLVPATLILPIFLGVEGALWAGPFADLGAMVITGYFIFREMRNLSALAAAQPLQAAPMTEH